MQAGHALDLGGRSLMLLRLLAEQPAEDLLYAR